MTNILRPWAKAWAACLPAWSSMLQSSDYGTVIGVAWELGAEDMLLHFAKQLCVDCGVNAEGRLVDANSNPVERPAMALIPPGIFGEFLASGRAV